LHATFCVRLYAYIHTYVHIVYTHMYMYICTYIYIARTDTYTDIHKQTHMVFVCLYVLMSHVYAGVHIHTHVHVDNYRYKIMSRGL